MKRTLMTAAVVVCCAGTVLAGPTFTRQDGPEARNRPRLPAGGGVTDAFPFSDNFDSYAAGSGIVGQGGWQSWGAAGSLNAFASTTQAVSAPNSMKIDPQTDIVQLGMLTTGTWELKCMTYYPSTNVGPGANDGGFIIGCNRFNAGGAGMTLDYWSSQIQWHPGTNTVRNANITNGESTPIVANQWVEFRQVVNLTTDKYDVYYNGVQLINQRNWSTDAGTPGQVSIACWDFYGGNAVATLPFEMYIDNITFAEVVPVACYADCDGVGGLTANDFACFLNAYSNGDSYANCDGVGGLTANDFACFLNAFSNGCS